MTLQLWLLKFICQVMGNTGHSPLLNTLLFNTLLFNMRWDPKSPKFIYKKLCIYSHMFKLQSPSKCSPFDAIHLSRPFFHHSEQVLNSLILGPFSACGICLFVCFASSTSAKHFPWRIFLIQGNKNKSCLGRDQVNGGSKGSCRFRPKTAEHSRVWAGALVNHPS